MYVNIVDKQIKRDLEIIPYSDFSKKYPDYTSDLFAEDISIRESYILLKNNNTSFDVLGYFILDNMHIINSSLFQPVKQSTINYYGTRKANLIQNENCKHIRTWVFDKQVCNNIDLKRIFTYITEICSRPSILWCEIDNKLIFYRIENGELGHTMAVSYFINEFLRIQ